MNTVLETHDPTIGLEEARRHLRASPGLFQALLVSGLLGFWTKEEGVSLAAIEHLVSYGTQWRPDLGVRKSDSEMLATLEVAGDVQPPSTQHGLDTAPSGVPLGSADQDVGWIAQFFFRPNPFFFPIPTEIGLLGPVPIRFSEPKHMDGTRLPTTLFPDPDGFLAMAMVLGNTPSRGAFSEALGVVMPVLDELSVQTDAPLPFCQVVIIGIPSGVITIPYAKAAPAVDLEDIKIQLGAFPELREAMALYREGISSNNPFHQFLTLWRAHENACYVRGQIRSAVKRRDVRIRREVLPDIFAFQGFVGMHFDDVRKFLRRQFRVALAHGEPTDGRPPKTYASPEDYRAVSARVPIMRFMAHVTIHNVRTTLAVERPRLIRELCLVLAKRKTEIISPSH